MAIRVCEPRAKSKGINIEISCDEALAAKINPPLLEQAVVNLLDNAIKFTPKGKTGKIIIKSLQLQKENITISIKDNGLGIPKQIQNNLFDISKNVSRKDTENNKGTGLGLYWAKEIIKSHGGTISVKGGEKNIGSTFVIF